MKLTREQVLHVAKLARIGLIPKEIEKFQKELSSILDYVEQLGEVNTENVEPTAQVTGLTNVMRKDEVKQRGDASKLLSATSLPIEQNQIKVKPVF